MEMSRLGKRIFDYRVRHDISQREMADRLGVYLNLVYRLENGANCHKRTAYRLSAKMDELERSECNV